MALIIILALLPLIPTGILGSAFTWILKPVLGGRVLLLVAHACAAAVPFAIFGLGSGSPGTWIVGLFFLLHQAFWLVIAEYRKSRRERSQVSYGGHTGSGERRG